MSRKRSTSPLLRMAEEIPAEENWEKSMGEDRVGEGDVYIMPVASLNLKMLGQEFSSSSSSLMTEDADVDYQLTDNLSLLDSHRSTGDTSILLNPRIQHFIDTHPYYLHSLIFSRDTHSLIAILSSSMTNKDEVIEERDHHGNTPLMLTVKLSHMSKDYVNIARILLKNGANPRARDREGWSILDEAIEKNDPVLVAIIFDFLHKTRRKQWVTSKPLTIRTLETLPNFYLEIRWEFASSIIPLVGKIAPSDTWRLWKLGSQLRLDMTLVGYKKLRSKRRNLSILFRDNQNPSVYNMSHLDKDLILINHTKQLIVNPMEKLDTEEMQGIVYEVCKFNPSQGDLKIDNITIDNCKSWTGRNITKPIAGLQAQKYKLQLCTKVMTRAKQRSFLLIKESEYFEDAVSQAIKPKFGRKNFDETEETERRRVLYNEPPEWNDVQVNKKVKAKVWVTEEYPISLNDFLPILSILGNANPTVQRLQQFLSHHDYERHFKPTSFPLKLDIPLSFSIRAIVRFQNYKPIDSSEQSIFEIPQYREESRKIAQKMLSSRKKRILLANAII